MESSNQTATTTNREVRGEERAVIVFGSLQSALRGLLAALGTSRAWILLDEWSVIPIELQPYMADIIRRCFFPISNLTVKFAAIEHRSNFVLPRANGQYVGLELGADSAADINLDDFMVFDNDSERSKEFFEQLVYNHVKSIHPEIAEQYPSPRSLRSELFNQTPTFEEFVRAAEGVPRDALHLLGTAAQGSFGQGITMPAVRRCAETWYTRDKMAALLGNSRLLDFLQRVVNEIIGHRRARAFLFRSDLRRSEIEELFDARLLHVLKRNISSHDQPGIRYNAYKLDYGCYVNLINTAAATRGLLNSDNDEFVEIPPDDWRSIRRAILHPDELND